MIPALFETLGFFARYPIADRGSYSTYRNYLEPGYEAKQLPDFSFLSAADNQQTMELLARRLAGKKRLCLVVVDGMGSGNLALRRGHIPYLRQILENQEAEITTWKTCMPSTTVAALTSLHTGVTPGIHGMTGYQAWDHKNKQVLNLINFRAQKDVEADEWCLQPTFFQLATEIGLVHFALGPNKFAGSKLSQISLRGANFVGIDDTAMRFTKAAELFKQNKADYVYCYSADLDHAGHHYGWESTEWISALEETDFLIRQLAKNLPDDVALVVTADHGMVTRGETIDIARQAAISKMVKTVSGEPRCLQIHLRSEYRQAYEKDVDSRKEILQIWEKTIAGKAKIYSDYRQVYGECAIPERMGELILVAQDNCQVVDSRFHPLPMREMPGIHGADSALEMEIPCLICR